MSKTEDGLIQLVNHLITRLSHAEERIHGIENTIEELFYSLISKNGDMKSATQIIEQAVIEYFDIKFTDFHRVRMGQYGDYNAIPDHIKRVSHARKWHTSIMVNIMHVANGTMKANYHWYSHVAAINHKPAYMGALMPKNAEDLENQKHLFSIGKIAQRIASEEGLLDERLEFV